MKNYNINGFKFRKEHQKEAKGNSRGSPLQVSKLNFTFYSELNNVDLNFEKLLDLCANNYENEKKEYVDNKNLETEKKLINIDAKDLKNSAFVDTNAPKDNKNMTTYFEKVFSENERKYLRRMFLTYSSDGVSLYSLT